MPNQKIRLDQLLVHRNLAPTSQKAQALIAAGLVLVDGQRQDKAGTLCLPESLLAIKGPSCPYVSRGGLKLAEGLRFFSISPQGLVCADIGASTGGFTDCLLQHGARLVFAIDVGYGQLAWTLRQDPRVQVLERTNIRSMKQGDLPEPLDLAVVDVSFISLKLVLPALLPLFRDKASLLLLVKPQFEVEKGQVGTGGVVRDPALHAAVLAALIDYSAFLGLKSMGHTASPIFGPKGNKEFLLFLTGPS